MKPNQHQFAITIENDQELAQAIDMVEGTLSAVKNYLQKNPSKRINIYIPREKKYNTKLIKNKLSWIPSKRMAQKIASQYEYIEFLRLIDRYFSMSNKERMLLYKDLIIFSTSVSEGIVDNACKLLNINEVKYKTRLDRLSFNGCINKTLLTDAKNQWVLRSKVHLATNNISETYTRAEALFSIKTTNNIVMSITDSF